MSFNKITIVGNLGRDPELKFTGQGNPVCTFSVATNSKTRDKDEGEKSPTWFRVTVWGRQAEAAAKYLTKGRPVYVEGRLRAEEWQDRDGKTRYSLDVQATDVQFIDSASPVNTSDPGKPASQASRLQNAIPVNGREETDNNISDEYLDEIPF
jgi:single-strand DNA-binding protein